ncbi:MAG: hypothetical protein QW607_11780 [Desulfurococcaceae archaeon]
MSTGIIKSEKNTKLIMIIGLIAFGALATIVLSIAGVINAVTVGKYGLWFVVGLMAIYILTTQTKSQLDNVIAGFLLLLSIGGVGSVWLIDQGKVGEGVVLLASMFLVFLFLLIMYMKTPVLGVVKRR